MPLEFLSLLVSSQVSRARHSRNPQRHPLGGRHAGHGRGHRGTHHGGGEPPGCHRQQPGVPAADHAAWWHRDYLAGHALLYRLSLDPGNSGENLGGKLEKFGWNGVFWKIMTHGYLWPILWLLSKLQTNSKAI